MKKILILAALLSCVLGVSAQAANGDVIGNIYSTDIRAYINGVEVPSYNIGGRTAVVVEDIMTDFEYLDDSRALLAGTLNPAHITGGQSQTTGVAGQIVGEIYETDIKTYKYDVELTSYNIGGKTAVAIEDLGNDGEFSEIGGKYIWNESERTISLEFMHFNLDFTTMYDNQANIRLTLNDDKTQAEAVFYNDKFSVGGNIEYSNDDFYDEENKPSVMIPIITKINGNDSLLGYYFAHSCTEPDRYESFCYFYHDVLRAGAETVVTEELSPREAVLKDYILNQGCSVETQVDTDNYIFVHMIQATPHMVNTRLVLIQNDGSFHDYSNDFESVSLYGTVYFENINIDKENEKVYFRYDKDYEIDLKTGELY